MRFWLSGPRIMGVRPGISFSPDDLRDKPKKIINTANDAGSFLYVIRGDRDMVKVGVTTNPTARKASLQTGSAFPLEFAFIGITPGNGYDIEKCAHGLLDKYAVSGEWFCISPELATAALMGAADQLGHPMSAIDERMANRVIIANATGVDPWATRREPFLPWWGWAIVAAIAIVIIMIMSSIPSNAKDYSRDQALLVLKHLDICEKQARKEQDRQFREGETPWRSTEKGGASQRGILAYSCMVDHHWNE